MQSSARARRAFSCAKERSGRPTRAPRALNGKCDWKGAKNGDACPKVAETYGTCNFDGRIVGCFFSTLADAGVFVETACAACAAGKSIEELGRCTAGRCSCQ